MTWSLPVPTLTLLLLARGSASFVPPAALPYHRGESRGRFLLPPATRRGTWLIPARSTTEARNDIQEPQQKQRRHEPKSVHFVSPLLLEGYPPAVLSAESGTLRTKPLLLYLPGFDGTIVAPFLQFPELGTEFDVRGMTVDADDRSTLHDLRGEVLDYLLGEVSEISGDGSASRPVYLMGESFGGILATEVALKLLQNHPDVDLRGMVLVNPATCFDRSALARKGPVVADLPWFLYPFALLTLIPLFTDEYSFASLILILRSKALPSVIDTEAREAYMGRTAFSLPSKLKYMPQGTLKWRLEQWLTVGCNSLANKNNLVGRITKGLRVLIVAGEKDLTLPSVEEAKRLSREVFRDATVHVVEGAGHASTCGSRVDLTAAMRNRFVELQGEEGEPQQKGAEKGATQSKRTKMKDVAARNTGPHFGLEPRYNGAEVGLNPLKYWSENNYRKWNGDSIGDGGGKEQ